MEYKGYNISELPELLLCDILQELKALRREITETTIPTKAEKKTDVFEPADSLEQTDTSSNIETEEEQSVETDIQETNDSVVDDLDINVTTDKTSKKPTARKKKKKPGTKGKSTKKA